MPGTDDSPAKRLSGFIAKYDPAIAKIVRAARSKLRRMLPAAVELVYDNYNALAIAFGPTEGASDAIVSLAVYLAGCCCTSFAGRSCPIQRSSFRAAEIGAGISLSKARTI